MNAAAQLERIAKLTPEPKVWICTMDRAFELVFWLCKKHVAAKQAGGWTLKGKTAVDWDLPCQECR